MKFKLVQFAILLALVMSVIYMAQTPNGYGHSADQHDPQFYVDDEGEDAGTEEEIGLSEEKYNDPRKDRDYDDSSGNGTESASSWDLRYYASGVINGNHASNDEVEQVYGVKVNLSASAGNSSCSASVTPSLTQDKGLSTPHGGWAGNGSIILQIYKNDNAHRVVPVTFYGITAYICVPGIVNGSTLETGDQNIEISVSDTRLTEMQSKELSIQLSEGPASVSGKWTGSVSQSHKDVYSYPVGIQAKLTCDFWARYWKQHYQQDKQADVEGNLGGPLEPKAITAVFNKCRCKSGIGIGYY